MRASSDGRAFRMRFASSGRFSSCTCWFSDATSVNSCGDVLLSMRDRNPSSVRFSASSGSRPSDVMSCWEMSENRKASTRASRLSCCCGDKASGKFCGRLSVDDDCGVDCSVD
jgi:hypothetical protein